MNPVSLGESAIAGVIGLVIGLVATFVASLIWPTPCGLSGAFVAVGFASFFAAFGGVSGAHTRDTAASSL